MVVRIELRGAGVLNSKAEFDRSRVPRLRVDLEGWKKAKEQEVSIQTEGEQGNEVEEDLQERDLKRKSNKDNNVRKTKKRKMERLVGRGEDSSHQGEYDEFNSLRSTDSLPDDWRGTGSSEARDHAPTVGAERQDHAPTTTDGTDIQLTWGGTGKHAPTGGAAGRDISVTDHALEMIEVVPQGRKRKAPTEKFKFKKKGKITKREEKELRRTNFTITSMFKQQPDPRPIKQLDEREEVEDMEVVDREREELLDRVKWKKKEWETRSTCRAVLMEMVYKSVDNSEESHQTWKKIKVFR